MAKKKIDNEIFKTLIEDYNMILRICLRICFRVLFKLCLKLKLSMNWGMLNILWKIRLLLMLEMDIPRKLLEVSTAILTEIFLEIEMLSLSLKSSLNEISISKLKGSNKEMDWKNTGLGRNIFSVKYLFWRKNLKTGW